MEAGSTSSLQTCSLQWRVEEASVHLSVIGVVLLVRWGAESALVLEAARAAVRLAEVG